MRAPTEKTKLADRATIETALVEHHRRFLSFVQKRVGDRREAEEIVQEAFTKALSHAPDLRDEERVVPWFYRILRHAVVDHWRGRDAARRAQEALAREWPTDAASGSGVEGEICRCFEPLLPTLRPQYAEMLRKVDLEGRKPADVAREQGITPNSAMVKLHRARRALRVRLEQSCRACAEHGCLDCTCTRT